MREDGPLVVDRAVRWRWRMDDARTRWRLQCRLVRSRLNRAYDWGPR